MPDERRKGDTRPAEHDEQISLTMRPAHGQPFRWLPKHGEPLCIGEWLSQSIIKAIGYLPVYIAIVVTATFVVALLAWKGVSL